MDYGKKGDYDVDRLVLVQQRQTFYRDYKPQRIFQRLNCSRYKPKAQESVSNIHHCQQKKKLTS